MTLICFKDFTKFSDTQYRVSNSCNWVLVIEGEFCGEFLGHWQMGHWDVSRVELLVENCLVGLVSLFTKLDWMWCITFFGYLLCNLPVQMKWFLGYPKNSSVSKLAFKIYMQLLIMFMMTLICFKDFTKMSDTQYRISNSYNWVLVIEGEFCGEFLGHWQMGHRDVSRVEVLVENCLVGLVSLFTILDWCDA